jgi:hypothetical protein
LQKKEKIGMMSSDTDIIDLTILPPPLTPDEEKLALSSIPSGSSSQKLMFLLVNESSEDRHSF